MRKSRLKWAFFILIAFVLITQGQEKGKSLSLTLEDAILRALKNNLNVAIEVLNPELADISLSRAQERFMPSLSFSFNKQDTDQASYSWLEASERVSTKSNSFGYTLTETIPTGGRLTLTLNTSTTDTNQKFQTINPRYSSSLRFNFSQPLLRDFGFKMNRREIIIAQNSLMSSEKTLEKTLMDTIYSVEEAYWNLVYSIESLNVQRQSLKLAQDLLAKNQREVEVGTKAPMEIISAQAEVASREASILQAEALVKTNEDRLKMILNISEEEEKSISEIVPLDRPVFEERRVDLEQALLTALQNRRELQTLKISLQNEELNLSYARNQLLPALNLTASLWSPGVSGDRILYLNNNPLTGVIVGKIPGGASDALKDTLKFKYNNWSVGLTLDFPLSNVISRANYAEAKVSLEQAILRLKNQEKQIYLEVKNTARAVETNYKLVQASKVARELAEKKLQAEEEKLKVGLSTNYTVLMFQRDLASARSAELKAIIDYNLSLANLNKALGVTLENKNIKIKDIFGDK